MSTRCWLDITAQMMSLPTSRLVTTSNSGVSLGLIQLRPTGRGNCLAENYTGRVVTSVMSPRMNVRRRLWDDHRGRRARIPPAGVARRLVLPRPAGRVVAQTRGLLLLVLVVLRLLGPRSGARLLLAAWAARTSDTWSPSSPSLLCRCLLAKAAASMVARAVAAPPSSSPLRPLSPPPPG